MFRQHQAPVLTHDSNFDHLNQSKSNKEKKLINVAFKTY